MSINIYLTIQRRREAPWASQPTGREPTPEGEYLVKLRSDTPESRLASAAYDAVLTSYPHVQGEDYDVSVVDEKGRIVLDTELPAYGEMRGFSLSVTRLPEIERYKAVAN